MEVGEAGNTGAKRGQRRKVWAEVLDATEKPRKLGQKRDIVFGRELFASEQFQGKIEAETSLWGVEESAGSETLC